MIKCRLLAIGTIIFICLPLVLALRGDSPSTTFVDEPRAVDQSSKDKACCCQFGEPGSDETLSDKSVYQLQSAWIRQDNQTINLKQLRGKVQVIAMIFTHCPSSCPRLVDDMKRLESQFDDIGFVLVSLDSDRDSPQVLNEYSARMNLCPKSWTLLHGQPDDVRKLAAVLGVRYKRTGDRGIAHSNMISVLNKQGELTYQQEGLGIDPTAITEAIRTALQSPTTLGP